MIHTELSAAAYILLGAALIMTLWTLIFGMRPFRLTSKYRDRVEPEPEAESVPASKPLLSVVATASPDEELTARFIDEFRRQNYPEKELIVVFDASASEAAILTEALQERYPEVHFTFIPNDSHNLSRHKLAVTVGIKAAHGEIILTTATNATPSSESWLSRMITPFIMHPGTELVTGYSHGDISELHGAGQYYRQFDSMLTACQWLGAAAAGHSYRGDRYNMAFRRNRFYANKGYAHTIHLHQGDDDLFVNEISNGANTTLILSPEARVTMSWGGSATRVWQMRKDAYDFTRRWLPKAPFIKAGVRSACEWGVLIACIAAALCDLPNLLPLIIAGVILIIFWAVQIPVYRRATRTLGFRIARIAFIPFSLWHPIGNALFRLNHHNERVKHYTWQRNGKK